MGYKLWYEFDVGVFCIVIIILQASGCKVLYCVVACDAGMYHRFSRLENGAGGSVSSSLCCVRKFYCIEGNADTVCM